MNKIKELKNSIIIHKLNIIELERQLKIERLKCFNPFCKINMWNKNETWSTTLYVNKDKWNKEEIKIYGLYKDELLALQTIDSILVENNIKLEDIFDSEVECII